MTSQQMQSLCVLKEKIRQTIENRPTRDQALYAVCSARQFLKHAIDILDDVFNRENEFHLHQDIYKKRKNELDKI